MKLLRSLALLLAMSAGLSAAESFQPPGMWIWDNWFAHDGARWHAFYLQLPKAVGPDRRWKDNDFYKHVGHATSTDLISWQDQGSALCALSKTWNDRHIATGSIIKHDRRWWMFFTGRGLAGDGVGLALSDDLMTWKTEPAPLFPLLDTFATAGKGADKPFESEWAGQKVRWMGISDPYVYPQPVKGWFYLILCARVLDVPIEESGCLTLLRSRDLRQWESAGIMAWPRCFERMETPQLWPHNGVWHLSFGGVLNMPWLEKAAPPLPAPVRGQRSHQNYSYALGKDFLQPGRDENLHFIPVPKGHYIMKVITLPTGSDAALFTVKTPDRGSCLSAPLPVRYQPNGSIAVGP